MKNKLNKKKIKIKMKKTYHVMTGGDPAMTLHLKLTTAPSLAVAFCGLITNLGMACLRSEGVGWVNWVE